MLSPTLAERVGAAVESGAEALFARQRADGVFAPGGDRFSPSNTAAALVALHAAGVPGTDPAVTDGVERLCATQRPDGGWAMPDVPTEVLATAVATAALRLSALEKAASAIGAGQEALDRLGGPEALPEPVMAGLVRQFDAICDPKRVDEARLPRLPLEMILLRGPVRRQLSLRLTIFAAMALGQAAQRRQGPLLAQLYRLARPAALAVVREAYEREGSTGAFSTDPWLTSLIATGIARSGLAPDIAGAAAERLRAMVAEGGGWDLMPLDVTWSSFATAALLEAGYAADPRLAATRAMFHERQQDVPFAALACPAGFWGFSSARSWPMALETAEVSSALLRLPGGGDDEHVRRGIGWLTAMQDASGSWGLAVRNSKPGGFGPCPHMTAKAVRALLDAGAARDDRRVTKALRWLERTQREDGSYEAMWYRGGTPGTAVVLETLCRAGRAGTPQAERARDWLLRTQLPDGSWSTGEGDEAPRGTVEETAWALHALLTAGVDPDGDAVAAAARRLLDEQRADGGWAGSAVNEYVRLCTRYADDGIASGLALRALAALRNLAAPGGQDPAAAHAAEAEEPTGESAEGPTGEPAGPRAAEEGAA